MDGVRKIHFLGLLLAGKMLTQRLRSPDTSLRKGRKSGMGSERVREYEVERRKELAHSDLWVCTPFPCLDEICFLDK